MSASQFAPFDSQRGLEPRRHARQPMLHAARLILVTGECHIHIRDLSPGGARIAGEDLPPVGTDVMLKCGGFEGFGTIAWVSCGHAGIAFDEELDEEAMEALRQPPCMESNARPGFGRRQHSDARVSDGQGWIDG